MSDTRNSHHAVQQTSNELICFGIKRRPRSNIASAFSFHFSAAIVSFAPTKLQISQNS
jgi:hypothetical protein